MFSTVFFQEKKVAFAAYLNTTLEGQHHNIYFNDVHLNIGDSYNPHHGTFVAPFNGTYMFSVTACCHVNHWIVLLLTVNDTVVGKIRGSGGTQYDSCSTKVFVEQLNVGDDVYVRHEDLGDNLFASYQGNPFFVGALLFSD